MEHVSAAAPGLRRWFNLEPTADKGACRPSWTGSSRAGYEALAGQRRLPGHRPPRARLPQRLHRTAVHQAEDRRRRGTAPRGGRWASWPTTRSPSRTWTPTIPERPAGQHARTCGGPCWPAPTSPRTGTTSGDLQGALERSHRPQGRASTPRTPPWRPTSASTPSRSATTAAGSWTTWPRRWTSCPDIVRATAGRLEIIVDGGIRRGSDVVKALALGADACSIGRPYLYGLAAAGQAGVAHVLKLFGRGNDPHHDAARRLHASRNSATRAGT